MTICERSFWDWKENNPWPKDSVSNEWKKRLLPESLSSTCLYFTVPLTPDRKVTGTKETGFPHNISLHCSDKLVTRAGTLTGFQVTLICLSNDQWMTTVIGLQGLLASLHRYLCWGGCTKKKNQKKKTQPCELKVAGEKEEQVWNQESAVLAGRKKWGQEPINRSSSICWIVFAHWGRQH